MNLVCVEDGRRLVWFCTECAWGRVGVGEEDEFQWKAWAKHRGSEGLPWVVNHRSLSDYRKRGKQRF